MEVQLNTSITQVNPFNDNDNNNKLITLPPASPYPPTSTAKDSGIKIRMSTNNIIIHTNQDESTSTPEDEASRFKLKTKFLYKGTKATIIQIIPQDD